MSRRKKNPDFAVAIDGKEVISGKVDLKLFMETIMPYFESELPVLKSQSTTKKRKAKDDTNNVISTSTEEEVKPKRKVRKPKMVKSEEISQAITSSDIREEVHDNITYRYKGNMLLESEKLMTYKSGRQARMITLYDDKRRNKLYRKIVNDVLIEQKEYEYDDYKSDVRKYTITKYSYNSTKYNSIVKSIITREVKAGAVYENIILDNRETPITNIYEGCFINIRGDVIHKLTGIKVDSINYSTIL